MNESYAQPSMPEGAADGILKGLYKLRGENGKVRLLGSGAILPEVVAAAEILEKNYGVAVEVFSATSYTELARDAREVERDNLLGRAKRRAHVASLLEGEAPIVAATDYVRALPHLIAPYVKARLLALGTDGFGRSDTRAALRDFFEVDRKSIVVAALAALAEEGAIKRTVVDKAIATLGVDPTRDHPWRC
jgi:pyruvate dehydrogenase E1 component